MRKRAEYEAFEFTRTADGVVVTNTSYATPSDHEYTVTIDDGLPSSCTCPADERFDTACKHRVAVAIHRAILDAPADHALVADGGNNPLQASVSTEGDSDPCACCGLPAGVPCWQCYRNRDQEFTSDS